MKPRTESETSVERKACAWAICNGWYCAKFTSPSRRSVPDRIFIRGGHVVFIEYKRQGKELTDPQAREHKRLRDAGANVFVAHSREETKAILGQFPDADA